MVDWNKEIDSFDGSQYINLFMNNICVEPNEKNRVCGECKLYENGCTISIIERKYGSGHTPACSDFKEK